MCVELVRFRVEHNHDVWCVFQVLKCVLVNHTGSHNKIHHTEEDSGCAECSTGSQRERQEDSLNSITSGKLLAFLRTSQTHPVMEAKKPIVCGLSASGIIPPLQPEVTDDDVAEITPTEVQVVEISDEDEEDMVELSCEEYRRNMGYLIRMEESEDDIEPEFRRMLHRMHEEEKKLRRGIKVEEGQSSKSTKRKRRR
ncbi:hypothetical protein Bca52824_058405 [Brassica carinata]|uniref:Uncharacterized protein n=1 Tax=Brassica carinata TaxID=52824 RepID=A0A8X7UDL4_BRACI|nr:hypothetical protein Bca52824_058405 [Brassica carinata]